MYGLFTRGNDRNYFKLNFEFSIKLTASYCNNWPRLQINCDHNVIHNNEIEKNQILTFVIPITGKSCSIKLIGIDKHRDTRIGPDNEILEDKTLRIETISINNVNMGDEFIRHLNFKGENGIDSYFSNQTFYSNGVISIEITYPIFDWIIEKKFRELLPLYSNVEEGMFNTALSKFEYRSLNEKIAKIEALLNDKNPNL